MAGKAKTAAGAGKATAKTPIRIRIESDGTARNTHIFDSASGREIDNVYSLKFGPLRFPKHPYVTCTLTLIKVPVHLLTKGLLVLKPIALKKNSK